MRKQIVRKSDERMGLQCMPRPPTTASTGREHRSTGQDMANRREEL